MNGGELIEKFASIILELKKRGRVVRMDVANRLTSSFDAVVVGKKVVILRTPSFSMPVKVSKMAFQRKIERLVQGGYTPFVVPNGRMSDEQVKEFVDSIEATQDVDEA
jgi:collagenase-like PrtC family protease